MEKVITKFFEGYLEQTIWYGIWTIPPFIILWVVLTKRFSTRRIQETRKAGKAQFLKEIKNSLITIIIFAGIDVFVFNDSQKNLGTATFKVYSNYTQHGGILYIVFITLLLFIVEDTYFYWMHKTVHSPKLYRYIHKVHHESIDTTPFTSYSFHPFEAALEIVPVGLIMAIAYIFPVHISALIIWQAGSIAFNVLGHSGYELYPSYWNNYWFLKWKLPSTHHNMHHERFNGNYGLYFIWWDRLMGTEFPDYEEKFRSIFNKKDKASDEVTFHDLQISEIVNENKEAYSIYFEKFPYQFRNYKAGQHVNLKVKINGETHYRTFSLSSSPTTDKFLRLTIKKSYKGLVTNYLINNLKINDTLPVSIPKGSFFIEQNPANTRTILLFAAGSGITPLFSMINTILTEEPNSNILLFYTNKNSESSIFLDELKSIEHENTNRFKLINHFSEKDGRATEKHIFEVIETSHADDYFICGATGFMYLVYNTLISLDVDKSKIKLEEFTPVSATEVAADAKIISRVKAIIDKKEYSFDVLQNELLLDAGLRQNINIPYSCRNGICGTCIADCKKGTIVMDEKQTFLSGESIGKSKILLCQSKAISENITIEINS